MKSTLATLLVGILLALSLSCGRGSAISAAGTGPARLSEDEKHRLYSAALAAGESPFESETFREVCRKIEIFDAESKQNQNYMAFVTAHIEWALKTENEAFKQQINTRGKAIEYIKKYLP